MRFVFAPAARRLGGSEGGANSKRGAVWQKQDFKPVVTVC